MSGKKLACLRSKKSDRRRAHPAVSGRERLLILSLYPLPGVVRTWAPRGRAPVLRHRLTHDHLSVVSAITADGKLYLKMQEQAHDSAGIIAFLNELQAQIAGKLLLIRDGAPIHRSRAVKQYLAEGTAARLHLERLPGYAPELNPDEGVWHYLKHVEMGSVCCHDLPHLREELTAAERRLRQKPDIIKVCFKQTGYP